MNEQRLMYAKRTCRRKVAHTAIGVFRAFAEIARRGDWGYGLRIYECENCGLLHLGRHRPKRMRVEIGRDKGKAIIARLLKRIGPAARSAGKDGGT